MSGAVEGIVDWDHSVGLFDESVMDFPNLSPDSASLSIDDIEQWLMSDNDVVNFNSNVNDNVGPQFSHFCLSDVLLDSPVDDGSAEVVDGSVGTGVEVADGVGGSSTSSPEEDKIEVVDVLDGDNLKSLEEDKTVGVVDVSSGNNLSSSEEDKIDTPAVLKENNLGDNNVEDDDNDPVSKKQKRQLRNRDAAMRSRERKKMYVKDLEMKSRFYEAECKRLGILLQGCYAENHALRLSLQNSNAFGASMTKQESAVLLLESLLLGSLLWFLGITCLLILPGPLSSLEAAQMEEVVRRKWESLAPREAGNRTIRFLPFQSYMMGKKCKGSRSRIKSSSIDIEVLA